MGEDVEGDDEDEEEEGHKAEDTEYRSSSRLGGQRGFVAKVTDDR
jgi:hypothetical protein